MVQKIEEIAIKVYTYFRVSYKGNSTRSKISDRDLTTIRKWSHKISKTKGRGSQWGPKSIFLYVSFQYDYWSSKDLKYANSIIPANMVFGDKALERWNSRREHFTYFSVKYVDSKNMSLETIYPKKKVAMSTIEVEDEDRILHYGSEDGFANCLIETSLFDPQSKHCPKCPFREYCKKVLKDQYYELYLLRNLEKNSTK